MSRSFDIVLIESWVQDVGATEICKEMREKKVSCPLIVWSKRWSEEDEINMLRAGAQDYVTTEMANDVVVARMIAHVRQFRASGRATYEIGKHLFCPTSRTLVDIERWDCLKLTDKQAGLLKYLCLADGKTVSYTELMTNVWYAKPDLQSHTIKTHIYRLRRAIADKFHTNDIIVTDANGYRLGGREKTPIK